MRWYLLSISCVSRFKTKLFCTTSSAKNNHESPILQNEITESVLSKYLPLSTIPTESDLKCIGERQVFGNISGIFAVDSLKCKYGFPQAFVRYPFTPKISSGMIRLSCPLLVKAIDVYEANNGINKLNELVHQNHSIQSSFHKVNIRWKNIKNTFVSTEQKEMLVSKMGSHSANSFLNSGIIGISENKTNDVKCVHAQVADYLLSGDNAIGEIALQELTNNGVQTNGCQGCSDQCSGQVKEKDATFWYVSAKNKMNLQVRKGRRIAFKEKMRAKNRSAASVINSVVVEESENIL